MSRPLEWKKRVYQGLPVWTRSAAATLYGYRARRWRYGANLERLVEEAKDRESWTAEQWDDWRRERLARVLHTAATHVPYYRAHWEERRRKGDSASWECLENWPVLEKNLLREKPRSFLAEGCDPAKMYPEHTSGTTGKPLHIWLSRDAVRAWYALFERRWRRWYGVSRANRWAILGGQLIAPVHQNKPPYWVWNAAFRQLYMSSYHLSTEAIPHYLEALRDYRVDYLLGYSSSLYTIAQEANRRQWRLPMKVVITNAEPLFPHQRTVIEEAFQCPVRETYGMSENVAAAGECEAGALHLWPEVGCLEIMDSQQRIRPHGSGELLATGLLNPDMPLIRYRVGDSMTICPAVPCGCGRSLPLLQSVEGRTDDILRTADGRTIGRLDPVFKGSMAVEEAQIVQETLQDLKVVLVPAAGFRDETTRLIADEIRARMGSINITFESVSRIPRGANGKFRAVISKLPKDR